MSHTPAEDRVADRDVHREPGPDTVGRDYERLHDAERRRVFADARSGGARIGADQLVAASRIYTPPYIVAFLLTNSLGATWLEMVPSARSLVSWPMLVPQALGPPRPPRPVSELRLLDPCCGCGAFLLPAFDLFVELYALERTLAEVGQVPAGWPVPTDDVPATIVTQNLFGADLDADAVAVAAGLLRDRAGVRPENLAVVEPPLGALDRSVWRSDRFDVVATNPPYVGFRLMDPTLKQAIQRADPDARSDLAAVFQRRCVELLADGGRCATVTPASWLTSREALDLRESILADGGPTLTAALGQRVFPQAPLLFVGLSVVERGRPVEELVVLRTASGSGQAGLASAVANAEPSVPVDQLRRLPSRPFLPGAPTAVLSLAGTGPTVGDLFRSFDGVWSGDTARDVRSWWEIDPGDDAWIRLSGGQGNEPWAGPIRRRIRREFAVGQPDRSHTVEFARVAGGRLAARLAMAGTAAQAGIVTLMANGPEGLSRVEEVLAIFNSRIGAAWLRTLTSGLNFNPGYAAQIPLGVRAPTPELVQRVRDVIALKHILHARDPTSDTFVDTVAPWVPDGLVQQISAVEDEIERLLADHLRLSVETMATMPPRHRVVRRTDPLADHLGVRVMRLLGMRWPTQDAAESALGRPFVDPELVATRPLAPARVAERLSVLLSSEGEWDRSVDLDRWVTTRLLDHHTKRFGRRPVIQMHRGRLCLRRASAAGGSVDRS